MELTSSDVYDVINRHAPSRGLNGRQIAVGKHIIMQGLTTKQVSIDTQVGVNSKVYRQNGELVSDVVEHLAEEGTIDLLSVNRSGDKAFYKVSLNDDFREKLGLKDVNHIGVF